MFKQQEKKSFAKPTVLTQDRWFEIIHDLEQNLFWYEKFTAVEIENITSALRNHKIVNNVDVLQIKHFDLFKEGNFICNEKCGDTVYEVLYVDSEKVLLSDYSCGLELNFDNDEDVEWMKHCYKYEDS